MTAITSLTGLEILDSRGRPTIKARCELLSGSVGSASVPSGASTGAAEALELRDGDPRRYGGLGCRKAVRNIGEILGPAVRGKAFAGQSEFDRALCDLDGTANKSRIGANALLAASLAYARARAQEQKLPLYEYFSEILGRTPRQLPRPTVNLFSGGKHAGGQVAIQDVLVVPVDASSFDDAMAAVYGVYQAAAELIAEKYAMRALSADEGGLAPSFESPEAMLEDAVDAIHRAGFEPGREIALAVDVASSHFFADGAYQIGNDSLSGSEMIERLAAWTAHYPIISLEDGLAEEDWQHWSDLCLRLPAEVLVLGDDLLCTNPSRIQRAVELKAANSLLLKVNQIGTLTEAAEAVALAGAAGWHVTASARSGETEDNWLADLAVGWTAGHIKVGSITQSERLAKYNRLLEIERSTGYALSPTS